MCGENMSLQFEVFSLKLLLVLPDSFVFFEKWWMIVWWLQTEKSLYSCFLHVPAILGAGPLYWMVISILVALSSCC